MFTNSLSLCPGFMMRILGEREREMPPEDASKYHKKSHL